MPPNPDEVAEKGHAIYETKIKPTLGPDDLDKLVVVDIYSGDYEIGPDQTTPWVPLIQRRPKACVWIERVGRKEVYSTGSLRLGKLA